MEVQIYKTGRQTSSVPTDLITIRVGSSVATMTMGEWSRLISKPEPSVNLPHAGA